MSDAPERIWRNSPPYQRRSAYLHGLVSWAAKEHADEDATGYVRADLHAALTAERDALREALILMTGAVCGSTGFAACVRADSGKAYPWEALEIAEAHARAALKGQTGESDTRV